MGVALMRLAEACGGQFVGASLLAKSVNDDATFLNERGALRFFASRLAPTVNSSAWGLHCQRLDFWITCKLICSSNLFM